MLIIDPRNPPAIPLKLLEDGQTFTLEEEVQIDISDNPTTPLYIRIPKGFRTDFASIPPEAGILGFDKLGRHSLAALVHDFMWSKSMGYELSNAAFFAVMRKLNVNRVTAFLMAFAVQAAGKSRYKKCTSTSTSTSTSTKELVT